MNAPSLKRCVRKSTESDHRKRDSRGALRSLYILPSEAKLGRCTARICDKGTVVSGARSTVGVSSTDLRAAIRPRSCASSSANPIATFVLVVPRIGKGDPDRLFVLGGAIVGIVA